MELIAQALDEEGLNVGADQGHGRVCSRLSRRSTTVAMSSVAADKYQ
jgi:hypothetical protein